MTSKSIKLLSNWLKENKDEQSLEDKTLGVDLPSIIKVLAIGLLNRAILVRRNIGVMAKKHGIEKLKELRDKNLNQAENLCLKYLGGQESFLDLVLTEKSRNFGMQ